MNITLAIFGLVCLLAAAAGGKLKAYGIEFPDLASPRPRVLVAVVGLLALGAAAVVPHLNTSTHVSNASSGRAATTGTSQGTSTTPKTSAPASALRVSPQKFLTGLPVASGDMPQTGLVTIGGQSFPKSLYYDNSTRVQTGYSTDFSLTGHWRKFVAWVGIQPDPADLMGSCTRDAGSTYQVLVNQNRVAEGRVSCEPQKISVSVAGAHELDLVFNTHPFYIATGEFAWANAQLK